MNATEFRFKMFSRYKNSGSPLEGVFELTGRCNFHCKMCYIHTKSNAEFMQTEKNGDWWITQIDAACDKGMIFALLTGGECLLHPDFHRIYSHLRERGVYTRINTNGILMTEKNVEFLKKNPPLEIQMTLYGVDEAGYERVTGVCAFHQARETIDRVKEAGLNLRVSVTPNEFAPGETARIIDFLKEQNVPYTVGEYMFTAYDDTTAQTISDHEVDIEEKIQILRKQYGGQSGMNPKDLPPVGGGRTEEVRGIRCSAGRVAFAISHDGCMMPCTAMYHLRVPINGAIDFDAAWEQMLNISRDFYMPIECEGCAYKKACYSCVVARCSKEQSGHCNPSVCEMTRRLVAAGVKKLEQVEKPCD